MESRVERDILSRINQPKYASIKRKPTHINEYQLEDEENLIQTYMESVATIGVRNLLLSMKGCLR